MHDPNEEYLYHYTNVSSLAMIFQNQNIKFNPLTVLDDSEEEIVKDKQRFGKYCFVSSWTDEKNESIPMWNMYTDLSDGVRIRLPKYPFQEYFLNISHLNKDSNYNVTGNGFYTIIPPDEFINQNYFLSTYNQSQTLKKVNYTNKEDKLCPIIKSTLNGNTVVEFSKLGINKNEFWSFQSEWRYILNFFPFGYNEIQKEATENNNLGLLIKLDKASDLPFNYYFLKLKPEKFEQIKITLSPKINEGNRRIVELLVEKFIPNANIFDIISDSELTKKIR